MQSNLDQNSSIQSESIGKLAAALSKAQGAMKNAKKDSTNPFYRSKYADLSSVIEAIKEPFSQNGLSYIQYVQNNAGSSYLYTLLLHESGEWHRSGGIELITSKVEKGIEKKDMQTLGSAITYARRFGLVLVSGLAQEDDDGNEASGHSPKEWRLGNKEYEYISQIAKQNGWSTNSISGYIKNNFKKQAASELTLEEYKKLREAILSTAALVQTKEKENE